MDQAAQAPRRDSAQRFNGAGGDSGDRRLHQKLSLGIKQLQPDAWETYFEQHHVNDVIHGRVLRLAGFGAFVELAEGVEGLCHFSEVPGWNGRKTDPPSLTPDMEMDFKIVRMNEGEKKNWPQPEGAGGSPASHRGRDSAGIGAGLKIEPETLTPIANFRLSGDTLISRNCLILHCLRKLRLPRRKGTRRKVQENCDQSRSY